ncbi:hypothetical protein CP8484711_0438A, partial [Chlamydia psittaci 84-8471/1]
MNKQVSNVAINPPKIT